MIFVADAADIVHEANIFICFVCFYLFVSVLFFCFYLFYQLLYVFISFYLFLSVLSVFVCFACFYMLLSVFILLICLYLFCLFDLFWSVSSVFICFVSFVCFYHHRMLKSYKWMDGWTSECTDTAVLIRAPSMLINQTWCPEKMLSDSEKVKCPFFFVLLFVCFASSINWKRMAAFVIYCISWFWNERRCCWGVKMGS